MKLSVEWFTAAEVAELALPGLPTSKVNVLELAKREAWRRPSYAGKKWRKRAGRGGGVEYHWSLLPDQARLQWTLLHGAGDVTSEHEEAARSDGYNELLWQHFLTLPDSQKDEAYRRLQALDKWRDLAGNGDKQAAKLQVAQAFGIGKSTLDNWKKLVRGQPRSSWLPLLVPQYKGRTSEVECSDEAWDALYFEYARKSKPTFSYCYRRIVEAAPKNGWIVPSEDTLLRRMKSLDPRQLILARGGEDALLRTIAPLERDKAVFHALEGVNADGHKFDVKVEWPDGHVGRPMVLAFQDLFSGKFLSWRIGKTENTNLIRLAFGDVVEKFGVPSHCYIDNGKAFASKMMTGGTAKRFRGKVREEDPEGIMVRLGTEVHFTTPYSGKSKPIERGFGDFARDIAKDIRLEGAYLGNNPLKKPDNYGERVVPLALFKQVLDEGVQEHNARLGRQSRVCGGKYSFNEVFDASYAKATIQKVLPGQKQLWLPVADKITVRGPFGFIEFMKNRFEAEFLLGLVGKSVTIRFDPDALHDDIHVYREDGCYLGQAQCMVAVGFNSLDAARDQAKRVSDIRRRTRELDAASRKLSLEEHLRLTAREEAAEDEPPEPKVVRPLFGRSNTALARKPDLEVEDELSPFNVTLIQYARAARASRGEHLRVVDDDD